MPNPCHSPQTPTKPKLTSRGQPAPKSWLMGLKGHFNHLPNFDWSRSFWKDINAEETTYILALKGNRDVQEPAQLWVTGTIENAYLVFADGIFCITICCAARRGNTIGGHRSLFDSFGFVTVQCFLDSLRLEALDPLIPYEQAPK